MTHRFQGFVLAPDIITPSQYHDRQRGDGPLGPTRRLMLAILEDAIRCFQQGVGATRKRDRRLSEEAEAWLFDEKCEEPLSFNSICYALAITPEYLRSGLRQWHARSAAGQAASPRVGRRLPVMLSGQIRLAAPKTRRAG